MCPPEWRNGRRAALKMQYRKVCGFESHLGHKTTPIPYFIRDRGLFLLSGPGTPNAPVPAGSSGKMQSQMHFPLSPHGSGAMREHVAQGVRHGGAPRDACGACWRRVLRPQIETCRGQERSRPNDASRIRLSRRNTQWLGLNRSRPIRPHTQIGPRCPAQSP